MSVTKITEGTKIEPGQWVCFITMMNNAVCGLPRRVVKVAGKRIYTMDRNEVAEEYRALKSAVYLCDTKEEGLELQELSARMQKEDFAARSALTHKLAMEVHAEFGALVKRLNQEQK